MHQLDDDLAVVLVHRITDLGPARLVAVVGNARLRQIGTGLKSVLFIGAFSDDQAQPTARTAGVIRGHFFSRSAVGLGHLAGQRGHGDAVAKGKRTQFDRGKQGREGFSHQLSSDNLFNGKTSGQNRPVATMRSRNHETRGHLVGIKPVRDRQPAPIEEIPQGCVAQG